MIGKKRGSSLNSEFFIGNLINSLEENLGPTFKKLIHAANGEKYAQADELMTQLLKEKPEDFVSSLILLSHIARRTSFRFLPLQLMKNKAFWAHVVQTSREQGIDLIKKMIDVRIDVDNPETTGKTLEVDFFRFMPPIFGTFFEQLTRFEDKKLLLEYLFAGSKRYSQYKGGSPYTKDLTRAFATNAVKYNSFALLGNLFPHLKSETEAWEELYRGILQGQDEDNQTLAATIEKQKENYGPLNSPDEKIFFSCMLEALVDVLREEGIIALQLPAPAQEPGGAA